MSILFFQLKQSNTTQRSLYERVKRGMGLGGEGGKRLEEREGIPQIMSQYWEWGKAGIISMADVVRCIFFFARVKSAIDHRCGGLPWI